MMPTPCAVMLSTAAGNGEIVLVAVAVGFLQSLELGGRFRNGGWEWVAFHQIPAGDRRARPRVRLPVIHPLCGHGVLRP